MYGIRIAFVPLMMLPFVACSSNFESSTFFETTINGKKSCSMSVRNKPLDEVCRSLEERLDAKVDLGAGVDNSQSVSAKIEKESWLAVLDTLAEELGLQVHHDVANSQYTLSAP